MLYHDHVESDLVLLAGKHVQYLVIWVKQQARLKSPPAHEGLNQTAHHTLHDYTPRLRAPRNLPRCTANTDTCEAVANNYPGSATANSYLGTTST